MITFTRAATLGARTVPSTADPARRTGDSAWRDLVWRHGRIDMLLAPLWAHVVGVDMSPAARLMHRMELELARCHQLVLMRRAAILPDGVERFVPGRFTRQRNGRIVRADEAPVH